MGEVIIYVRDLPTMKRFYSERLGFRVDADRGRLVALKGGAGAEIVLHSGRSDDATSDPQWLLQIIVEDIDEAVAELKKRGVDVSGIEDRPYGRYARFVDPEGNRLGLEQA
ncbi:MAG: VOC family protein [Chloroflexi bacterium]|nr:VOC family protein [Chloroflexota bacterium]